MTKKPSITCSQCLLTSYNENDIQQRYCGHCYKFHEHESDYRLGPATDDPSMTLDNVRRMRIACMVWLNHEQRETIARAIDTRSNALIAALAEHSGEVVGGHGFAELLLQAAVIALDLPEDSPGVGP
jgi:hypothetical protein